jgi:glycosyltransferase involved in cell wall biosynthesis
MAVDRDSTPTADKHVIVHCNADLNLIDGSSVWIASISQVLASIAQVRVSVLLRRSLTRSLLVEPLLARDNVRLIDPFKDAALPLSTATRRGGRLQPADAAAVLSTLDQRDPATAVLVRGLALCDAVTRESSLQGKVWCYVTDFDESDVETLRGVHGRSARLLCQTAELQRKIQALLGVGADKMSLLPPMIPDAQGPAPSLVRRSRRLVYAGKLAPLWRSEEMAELVADIRLLFADAELHVAGDKIHNAPPTEGFPERMQRLLETTEGLIWHRAVSRDEVQALIDRCDLGFSWRHPLLDDTVELSTKLLEYGSRGKPVLLNRVPMHEELLGRDYPLFCNTREEVLDCVRRAFSDQDVYQEAARRTWEASQRFTFARTAERLAPLLEAAPSEPGQSLPAPVSSERVSHGRLRLLVAGHDLKFVRPILKELEDTNRFEVRVDQWAGHSLHDEAESQKLAQWAEVVVAEWCLGNAVWYSHHLRGRTPLVVRLHRVEVGTKYPSQLNPDSVHAIVAVSPAFASKVQELVPRIADRVVYIPNAIDCATYDRPKLGGGQFRLGVLGFVPCRKRLDLALDLFEALRRFDHRYVLFLKGRMPVELGWVWNDAKERRYFLEQSDRINRSAWRNSVVFEPFGDDVAEWFRKVGFIISPSDCESFHMSVAEGMASGTLPVIRRRNEACQLYPEHFVYDTLDQAVDLVQRFRLSPDSSEAAECKTFIRNRYGLGHVASQWAELLERVVAG